MPHKSIHFTSPPLPPIRQSKGNRIALVIDELVVKHQNPCIRDHIRESICAHLRIKNQYTMILNNTTKCSLAQLVVIAQVLQVTVDQLILWEV